MLTTIPVTHRVMQATYLGEELFSCCWADQAQVRADLLKEERSPGSILGGDGVLIHLHLGYRVRAVWMDGNVILLVVDSSLPQHPKYAEIRGELVEMFTCYRCGSQESWLAPDSRCGGCTNLSPEEVRGE